MALAATREEPASSDGMIDLILINDYSYDDCPSTHDDKETLQALIKDLQGTD